MKQSDIPDISKDDDTDTKPVVLDAKSVDESAAKPADKKKSWINNTTATIALSADKNKDVSAAVLGVDSFNKFNAGATKVGLVTNVSYDKKDVVSVDVAYNGKVETISSAEKTDFDDVVSVLDYNGKNNTKEYSVGSRTETINYTNYNGIMKGSNLRDYLNKSAAYAEITVDADGKLTDLVFMDQKDDTNTVIGNYYQVSRKVIADTKEGKWISTVSKTVNYKDEDTLESIDTKNDQTTAADFADEVFYYTIDGKPTRVDGYEGGKALAILSDTTTPKKTNFDGNPDIKTAEASDIKVSDIRNDDDAANDLYYVADIASKIDDNDKGDVVAVYMFDDEMEEAISLKSGAKVDVTNIVVGKKAVVNVTLPQKDDNLDTDRVYVEVDGKKFDVKDGANPLDLGLTKTGTYTIDLYGYNTANKKYEKLASDTFKVNASDVTILTVEGSMSVTGTATPTGTVTIDADAVLEETPSANIVIKNEAGRDVTDDFNIVPTLSVGGQIIITGKNAVKAGTYTVSVTKGGYTFNDVTFKVDEVVEHKYNLTVAGSTPATGGSIEIAYESANGNSYKQTVSYGKGVLVNAIAQQIADVLNGKTPLKAEVKDNVVTVTADYVVTFNINDAAGDGVSVTVAKA